jgi:hypothetical protein
MKASADTEPGRSNGTWIEAVVDKNGSAARAPAGALRIYFAAGAYCQISSAAEVALAAELLGRLAQSDDQLQGEPENLFVGRLLRYAQRLQCSSWPGEQQLWR